MTTAIGPGGIGPAIARQLAAGGETPRLCSAGPEPARTLAAEIGSVATGGGCDRDGLPGTDAVVLALRFIVLKGVIDQIARPAHRQARGRFEQPAQHRRAGYDDRAGEEAERLIRKAGFAPVKAGGIE